MAYSYLPKVNSLPKWKCPAGYTHDITGAGDDLPVFFMLDDLATPRLDDRFLKAGFGEFPAELIQVARVGCFDNHAVTLQSKMP